MPIFKLSVALGRIFLKIMALTQNTKLILYDSLIMVNFRFKNLALFLFCFFIFWSSISIDQSLSGESQRFPLHRFLMVATLVISIANYQAVLSLCNKNIILLALIIYVLTTAAWAGDGLLVIKLFIYLIVSYLAAINVAKAYSSPNADIKLAEGLYWLFFLLAALSFFVAKLYPQYGLYHVKSYGYVSRGDLYLNSRWVGVTSHPNRLGEVGMLLAWVSSYLFFIYKNIGSKLLMTLSICFGIFITKQADSMTSFICGLAAIALVVYYQYEAKINPVFLVAYAVLTFFAFMFFVVLGDVRSVIETVFSLLGRSSNFSGRTLQWQIVINEFMGSFKSIAFGVGFDNLNDLTKKYKINMMQVHNGYLEILLKGGITGAILFFIVGYKTFFDLRMLKKINFQKFIFLNSIFFVLLIHNLAETSFLQGISSINLLIFFIIIYSGFPNAPASDFALKPMRSFIKNSIFTPAKYRT